MKHSTTILLIGVFMLAASLSIQAQQTEMPPSRVNVKFNAKYPEQAGKASWKQADNVYVATFSDKGKQTISRFSDTGQWLGSQTQLQESDWRSPTRQYLAQNHKGYKYLKGYRFDDARGSRYQLDIQSNSGNKYRLDFDKDGNFTNESPLQE